MDQGVVEALGVRNCILHQGDRAAENSAAASGGSSGRARGCMWVVAVRREVETEDEAEGSDYETEESEEELGEGSEEE